MVWLTSVRSSPIRNSLGTSLSGDYRNTGTSLSVEYGKRIKKDNGFYIDPNAELTLSRLSGVNFDARTNTGSTVHINSDAVNSVIGRIGVGKWLLAGSAIAE